MGNSLEKGAEKNGVLLLLFHTYFIYYYIYIFFRHNILKTNFLQNNNIWLDGQFGDAKRAARGENNDLFTTTIEIIVVKKSEQ